MRLQIFLSGLAVLALGYFGTVVLSGNERLGFLVDALKLGGALVICGLFSFKYRLHGVMGAGVVALIGFCFSAENVLALPRYWMGHTALKTAELLSSAAAIVCLLLLVSVARGLLAEKRRRAIAELSEDPQNGSGGQSPG